MGNNVNDSAYFNEKWVKIPDEIWSAILGFRRIPAGGFSAGVKLLDGRALENIIVNNRGYLVGRIASGIAGGHGDIDVSMLMFTTDDIEAIEVPAFHFWQHPKWIELNPHHPARRSRRNLRE